MIDQEYARSMSSRFTEMAESDSRLSVHRLGHTKKLRRYVAAGGGLAIEIRKGAPTIWIEKAAAERSAYMFSATSVRTNGRTGRNSNLSGIFRDTDLVAIKPASDVDFLAALGAVI